MSFSGQLQPMTIHKLHVFVQIGLMIAKDYQGKKVQVLEKIQCRSESQVIQTTIPENF